MHTATIITIGDELLIGQVTDTNSGWIAQQLNALGIEILRRVSVGDTKAAITDVLDEELPKADLLILTGGLGPTGDDITKPVLAGYFGGKLVVNDAVLEHIKNIFTTRKRPFLERNMKQAEVPDNCQVLHNAMGTAPGMWFEQEGKVIISLPGVPFEMMNIMEREALPRLRQRFVGGAVVHRTIITAGEGESFVAERIKDLEEALPAHIKLAYLPNYTMLRLRLTANGVDEKELAGEVEVHRDKLAERLENIVVALDDLPMERILGKLLLEKGETIGLAESCTGGYIAHQLTQVMGSSDYFKGSIVCYDTQVKLDVPGVKEATIAQHGVVSEAVAIEMAQGARKVLKTDYGFGVTGMLSGDTEDVGMVYMAVCNETEQASKTFHFHLDRWRNKELAMQHGLLFIWKFVEGKV